MRVFLQDFVAFAIASVAATLLPYFFMSGLKMGDLLLGLALLPLIWGGPLIVAFCAFVRPRWGRIAGAACGIPMLLAFFWAGMLAEAAQIRMLDQRVLLPAQQRHKTVIVENSSSSMQEGAKACSEYCLQLLMDGRYVPALYEKDREFQVFRLAHGQDCIASPHASRYIELLARGYAGTCVEVGYADAIPDALIIRENFRQYQSETRQSLPFKSTAYELLERTNGQESLLGRWVCATVPPASVAGFWGMSELEVGDPVDPTHFYSEALGLPLADKLPLGEASLQGILAELRPLFGEPEAARWAMNAFEDVARRRKPEDVELLQAFIEARTGELKASSDPDPNTVRWFQGWVDRLGAPT